MSRYFDGQGPKPTPHGPITSPLPAPPHPGGGPPIDPPGRPGPPDPDFGIEVTPPPEPPQSPSDKYPHLFGGKLPGTFPTESPAPRLQSLSRKEIKQLYVRHPNRNFAYNQHVTFKR